MSSRHRPNDKEVKGTEHNESDSSYSEAEETNSEHGSSSGYSFSDSDSDSSKTSPDNKKKLKQLKSEGKHRSGDKKHREEVEIEEGEEIHYSIKTSAELLLQQKSAQINLLRDYLTKVQELKTLIEEQPYTDLVLEIYTEILDEISTEVCFDIHKQLKLGSLCLNCDSVLDFVDKPGSDVFGQLTSAQRSSNESFDCPHCSRPVIASRFAPHLEKCMGLGRNSSRIATRRISTKAYNGHSEESEESDDAYHEKNGKRVRTGKTSEKKKVKSSAVLTAAQSKKMQQTIETIKATHSKSKIQRLMETKCGVISQVTGKLCTKSLNCPQHTPEQRRLVRHHLLSDEIEEENQSAGFIASEDDLENE